MAAKTVFSKLKSRHRLCDTRSLKQETGLDPISLSICAHIFHRVTLVAASPKMSLQTESRSLVAVSFPRNQSETPMTHVSGKISTPPHSIAGKRSHAVLETPVRASETFGKSLLLSPAFSSPQQPQQPVFEKHSQSNNAYIVPSAAIDSSSFIQAAKVTKSFSDAASEPFSESFNDSSFNDSFNEGSTAETSSSSILQDANGQKRKKQKKVRRETRDSNFSLDSSEKPPYSYATLIGMSILSHPEKQLTLSQIYLWISETFKYYRREEVGWQNLIRHNLSLNKAFVKGEKSKDGKGHFWCIQPDSEDLFLKAKNNKKSLYHEVMDQLALVNKQPHPLIPLSPSSLTDDDSQKYSSSKPLLVVLTTNNGIKSAEDEDNGRNLNNKSDSPLLRTPVRVHVTSDLSEKALVAGKNLGFTLSFSCSLNFEFLPLPTLQTGPLLEPISPGKNVVLAQNLGNLLVQLPSISVSKSGNQLTQLQPPITGASTPRAVGTARTTPKSSVRTPLRLLRTPLSGAMIYKLGYSPSYLEEFYHSPFGAGRAVLNSYDDDDMLMRAFDSPAVSKTAKPSLLGELRKATTEDLSAKDALEIKH